MGLIPHRPLRAPGLPAAPVAGRYKERNEDFVVEEIPLYEPSGEGGHLYLWIEKRGLSTLRAIDELARALDISPRAFGYAGMKDRHAVTRQWLSVEGATAERARALEIEGLQVLDARPHGNKLKMGHLRGNRFEILLRGVGVDALGAIDANLGWLAAHGVPNWVGEQRFGQGGANLDKGMRLLRGSKRAARRIPKKLVRLIISAVQSEVFNRVLARRLDSFDRVEDGDVAWLHQNGACFLVEDALGDQIRCQRFEISPSGPMPGPRMLCAEGGQGQLEADVLRELELDLEIFGQVAPGLGGGVRRTMREPLRDVRSELCDEGAWLRFTLGRGAFATSVLRELLVEPGWFDQESTHP